MIHLILWVVQTYAKNSDHKMICQPLYVANKVVHWRPVKFAC